MSDIVPVNVQPRFDRDLLFEQAASAYLEVLDETGKPPRIRALIGVLSQKHPEYTEAGLREVLESPEFTKYLGERRKRHLIERTAARLVAAELGSRMSVEALEILQERMRTDPDSIKARELVDIAKLGMELNAAVDKDLTEVTGNMRVSINLRDVLVGLPPERAAALMAEYARYMASPAAAKELMDGTDSDSK